MTYLVTTANAMYSLLAHNPPGLKDVATAASLGCNTLINLVDDLEFKKYVRILAAHRIANSEAFDAITGRAECTLGHFHSFMEVEKRVMREGGLHPQLVEELTEQADQLIHRVREWNGDPQTLFAQIARVRDDTCSLADKLRQELKQKQENEVPENETRRRVRRILYVVAGGAIIVLNVVSSLTLSLAGAAVSGALGSAFIGQAIPPA